MAFRGFPKGFVWGAAASSYQIEGAWNIDGKGESIWDRFSHRPGQVANDDNGDIACDHYHHWREDVALLKLLGVKSYRFSVSWPRVLPQGFGKPNPKGLDFYERLVEALLEAGITPTCNLYHWDLPQALQDEGGWPARITTDRFAEFADLMYKTLGDRVPYWVTVNEPWVISFLGHANGQMAPGLSDHTLAYQTAHNLLLAHGKAVRAYRARGLKGQIGIVLNTEYPVPETERVSDVEACRRFFEQYVTLFAEPLFKGSYPAMLMDWIGPAAPKIEPGDFDVIREPMDFMGMNYYTARKVGYDPGGGHLKTRVTPLTQPMAGYTEMGWGVYPNGLKEMLRHYTVTYPNLPPLIVSENGAAAKDVPDENEFVADKDRIAYLRAHIQAAADAIAEGVDLRGYFVWSLLDNFEWAEGYRPRFGIVRVNYETQKRTPKESFYWYKQVIEENGLWE